MLLLAMLCLAATSCSKKCGENAYDPKIQFCYDNNRIVDKCSGEVYNPNTQFCHTDGKTYSCKDQPYNPDVQFCYDNNIVVDKCGSKIYDLSNQFCDTRDNKIYKFAKIGEQVWMAENLNYAAEGSICYENKPENCDKYGRLYNWNIARSVCTSGWHLPTNEEWSALIKVAGGGKTAGKHLKAKSGWNKSGNGLDRYGFSALPGGYRENSGKFSSFNDIGKNGNWWSIYEDDSWDSGEVFIKGVGYGLDGSYMDMAEENGFSIRCIKD
jgi:uncharacterized protein (TIGR02145 family)